MSKNPVTTFLLAVGLEIIEKEKNIVCINVPNAKVFFMNGGRLGILFRGILFLEDHYLQTSVHRTNNIFISSAIDVIKTIYRVSEERSIAVIDDTIAPVSPVTTDRELEQDPAPAAEDHQEHTGEEKEEFFEFSEEHSGSPDEITPDFKLKHYGSAGADKENTKPAPAKKAAKKPAKKAAKKTTKSKSK
jgi:hypothetical protein